MPNSFGGRKFTRNSQIYVKHLSICLWIFETFQAGLVSQMYFSHRDILCSQMFSQSHECNFEGLNVITGLFTNGKRFVNTRWSVCI